MSCVNKITIIGFLGADPTWVQSSDKQFITFSVATSERWKNKDGTYEQRTQWHKVVVFNDKYAEAIARLCKKGSRVYVEGKLLSREQFSPKTRESTIVYEIVIDRFSGLALCLDKDAAVDTSVSPKGSLMDDIKAKFQSSYLEEDESPF